MFGDVTLGTNDLARASAFDAARLMEISAKPLMDFGRGIACGISWDRSRRGATKTVDSQPATVATA